MGHTARRASGYQGIREWEDCRGRIGLAMTAFIGVNAVREILTRRSLATE